jgi:uncharacterized protein YcbK (DUF882 family)
MAEVASRPIPVPNAPSSSANVNEQDMNIEMAVEAVDILLEEENEDDVEEEEEDDPETLDLSGQGLEKLSRAAPDFQLNTMTLILDRNNLQRMDNIHTFQCIEKVQKMGAKSAQEIMTYGRSKTGPNL